MSTFSFLQKEHVPSQCSFERG
jgi:hypothetical protein